MTQPDTLNEIVSEQYRYEEIQNAVIKEETEKDSLFAVKEKTLKEINPDFKGWIYIPDTAVNYPVVQGADNSCYLNRSFEKEYSVFGSIFLSAGTENNSDNLVIHGHNMGPGREEMFSGLLKYENNDYAAKHNCIYYSQDEKTDEKDKYIVFAVVCYDYTTPDDFIYMISDFPSEEEREAYIDYLKANSTYTDNTDTSGQLLVLSTCYDINDENTRLLVCAAKTTNKY